MPALTLALDLSVGGPAGHHAVQIVGFDTHLLRDLGDGDAGRRAHELERLIGARATPAAATRPARTATGGGGGGGASGGRGPRPCGPGTTRSAPAAGQRAARR